MRNSKESVSLQHVGDHHQAKLTIDPQTKSVKTGVIYNFSENSGAMIRVRNKRVDGTIMHTGKTHSFQVNANKDGGFNATIKEKRFGGLQVNIKGGKALLRKGKIPEAGISVNGKHHKFNLMKDRKGKFSGSFEAKATKNARVKIGIKKSIPTGQIIHSGRSHETKLNLSKEKWKAGIALKKGRLKFGFNVEGGVSKPSKGLTTKAGLSFGF